MKPPYVPPIKIQGKKTKLVSWILDNVKFPPDGRWIEPFMGSGVVGFNFAPDKAVFADSNPHIIGFYNQIKEGKITSPTVKAFLEKEGALLLEAGDEHFYSVRKRFNETGNPLDFLFLNRSCFNGMIRFNKSLKFNVPFCKKPNRFARAYVTKIVNQVKHIERLIHLKDWEFKCQDFTKTLSELKEGDFVYCDPPYIGRHVDYYDSWTEEEENQLHNLLWNSDNHFVVSTWHSNQYRKNEFIESLWSDCEIVTKEHFYHVGAKETNRNAVQEALLLNYKPPKPYEKVKEENLQLAFFEPKETEKTTLSDKL